MSQWSANGEFYNRRTQHTGFTIASLQQSLVLDKHKNMAKQLIYKHIKRASEIKIIEKVSALLPIQTLTAQFSQVWKCSNSRAQILPVFKLYGIRVYTADLVPLGQPLLYSWFSARLYRLPGLYLSQRVGSRVQQTLVVITCSLYATTKNMYFVCYNLSLQHLRFGVVLRMQLTVFMLKTRKFYVIEDAKMNSVHTINTQFAVST